MSTSLICSNCKKHFNERENRPYNLPCSHILCYSCINDLNKGNNKIYCPQCCKTLTNVNLQKLQSNRKLLNIIESLKKANKNSDQKNSNFSPNSESEEKEEENSNMNNSNSEIKEEFDEEEEKEEEEEESESEENSQKKNFKNKKNDNNNQFSSKKSMKKSSNKKKVSNLSLESKQENISPENSISKIKRKKNNDKPNQKSEKKNSSKENNEQNSNNVNEDDSKEKEKINKKNKRRNSSMKTDNNKKKESTTNVNKNVDKKLNTSVANNENNNNKDNVQKKPEYCNKHPQKEIEFFCSTCTCAICSFCIYEVHNGHVLSLLEDMSVILKNNMLDLNKILERLKKDNEDNILKCQIRASEITEQKNNQVLMVVKSFDEIFKKIEEKKNAIIAEFEVKYEHETKRFDKIQKVIDKNKKEIDALIGIIDEVIWNFDNDSDAKILKKVKEYTDFLQRSGLDIKRLHKNELTLKTELAIDPAMKPTQININDFIRLLNEIDPKKICYPPFIENYSNKEDSTITDNNTSMTNNRNSIKNDYNNNNNNNNNNYQGLNMIKSYTNKKFN